MNFFKGKRRKVNKNISVMNFLYRKHLNPSTFTQILCLRGVIHFNFNFNLNGKPRRIFYVCFIYYFKQLFVLSRGIISMPRIKQEMGTLNENPKRMHACLKIALFTWWNWNEVIKSICIILSNQLFIVIMLRRFLLWHSLDTQIGIKQAWSV